MRTKLNLVTLLLCVGMYAHAQNYNPSPIPCSKITPASMNNYSGVFEKNCIIDDNNSSNNININGNQNVELKAGDEINLDGEVWVHPNSNGNFYANIEPNNIGLAWYQPYDTPGQILKYDKLEIGIDLPDNVNQQIENFVQENQTILKLNPFNPEQIDVKAEFWVNTNLDGTGTWYGPIKIYGFYYEEFFEDTNPNSEFEDWSLNQINTEHKFRVRFAPPNPGLWRCKITATINQSTVYTSNEFTFTCVNSSNKGYVKVGSSKHYLQLGNETYFQISRNIPQPDMTEGGIWEAEYNLYNINNVHNGYDDRKLNPVFHIAYRDELSLYKNSGGDEFRFMNFADWYEIEFEKLNNYYDRLNSAWELDRLVDHCTNIGLRIYFNLQNHEPTQWIGDQSKKWDWPAYDDITENQSIPTCYTHDTNDKGYCYHSDATYGVETPEEFLTDADCKKFYKYRLRYMISRWGYSTYISLFEIRSEMNNTAKYQYPIQVVNPDYNPNDPSTGNYVDCEKTSPLFKYYTDVTFLSKVSEWHNEMAEYLKTQLYFPHLLSVDYTGNPREMYINDINGNPIAYNAMILGDESYYSPYIDVAAYNSYPGDIPIDRFDGNVISNLDLNYLDPPFFPQYFTTKIDKPILIGETGFEPAQYCDNGIEFIKDLWIGPFTGNANSSNQWHYQHDYSLTQYQVYLKNFLYGINLAGITWVPHSDVRGDLRGAMYSLISVENKKRAIGIIDNRTFNYYTAGCQSSFDTDPNRAKYIPNQTNTQQNTSYTNPQTFSSGGGSNRIELVGMGVKKKYIIDWYNPITNSHFSTTEKRSSVNGDLELEYTDLAGYFPSSTNNWQATPLIAFKVRRKNEPAYMPTNDSINEVENILNLLSIKDSVKDIIPTVWIENNKFEEEKNIVLFPNPAGNIIQIGLDIELVNAILTVTTMSNELIIERKFDTKKLDLNVSVLASGQYMVRIENNGKIYTSKFIKQ